MRVIRWKNAITGVESLNITATGIYFPVGKTDSSFIARYSMASAEQTASVERVSSPNGSRVGSPAINVSGTTEVVVNERRGLSTGIIVTAISGTLISVLDDNTPITNFPDAGLDRFPAKEDADAYVYGSTVPQGIPTIIGGVPYSWGGAMVGWASSEWGPIYNGTTLPLPTSGEYCRIRVANPAVPRGWSWLEWTGTIWAPPSGELIAGVFSDYITTPIASVIPGVTTSTEIWAGSSIPEYMIPNSLLIRGSLQANIQNASGVAGANIGLYASSSPVATNGFNGIVSAYDLTPTAIGVGNVWQVLGVNYRWGNSIGGPDARGAAAGTLSESYAYTPGAGKLRLSARPSSVTDRVNLYGAAIYSAGNL